MTMHLNNFSLPFSNRVVSVFLAIFTSLISFPNLAQEEPVKIYALNWLDKQHVDKQVERIDDIARAKLGVQVRNNRDDLVLLQRIVNKGLIDKNERLLLQAMGAVLGNLLINEYPLQWMVYEDEYGRSHAACVKETDYCLFPITMLSRRMEVGIIVNVEDIYNNAVELITPYLPKDPYNKTEPSR